MEVNNYQRIFYYLEKLGDKYTNYPILLFYRKKKADLLPEDYNNFKKIKFYDSIKDIDMEEVKDLCKINKCRCYLTIVDSFVLKVLGKITLTLENLNIFLQEEMKTSKGLHLIDIDEPVPNMSKLAEYLESLGASGIYTFPSRTGNSLVFYGPGEIISKYNNGLEDGCKNTGHEICQLNLYIPEFYDK